MSGSHRPSNKPWTIFSENNGDHYDTTGGIVIRCIAGTNLYIGDYVYFSDAFTVTKSATPALYVSRAGFVVGGDNTGYSILQDDADVLELAAATSKQVLVCVLGICKAVAGEAIVAGERLAQDGTIAGRVKPATDLTIDTGATPVTSSAANGAIIVGDGFNKIAGIALNAASGLNQKLTVLIR